MNLDNYFGLYLSHFYSLFYIYKFHLKYEINVNYNQFLVKKSKKKLLKLNRKLKT